DGLTTEASADIRAGLRAKAGTIAPSLPAAARPAQKPVQAGPGLTGRALPTNQWWTSALTGPLSQPMWTHPVAAKADKAGLQFSAAEPTASANSVVTPFTPAVTAGEGLTSLRVTGYGAFHVRLSAGLRGGGSVETTLVQGSPILSLRFRGAAPVLRLNGPSNPGGTDARILRIEAVGQTWDAVTVDRGSAWTRHGDLATASGTSGLIALAPVPLGVDLARWRAALLRTAGVPVVDTTASVTYDHGTVTQTLRARRASGGPGVWALLPHQRDGLDAAGVTRLAGGYGDARGPLSLVEAEVVRVRVPMPGLLPGVPALALGPAAAAAVRTDLAADLAAPPGAGGSYFGLKELGRLAVVAEVANRVGTRSGQAKALARLRPQLTDWLTYSGPADGRYFGYDSTWGGLIAYPAEFGSADYNDHHFQYGYLVYAAAVLAESDPSFARDYGDTVDLIVRDFAGSGTGIGGAGLPPFRSFNAYQGHSAASGFAPFADGNNQESSSEAVHAWEAVTRWGLVRGNADLVTFGVTHYALEAAAARRYWLGETGARPAGYRHRTTGIVFDAKYDYATFFDAKPEAVVGIQLLPLTFGSLYRGDPGAAAERSAELRAAAGGPPRSWGDLFAADLALADPGAARRLLTDSLPREPSTSRALVRYWTEVLAAYGPPRTGVTADSPFGLAFGRGGTTTLAVVNPTGKDVTVTFRGAGRDPVAVTAGPRRSVVRR
ncbi:MAG: endo,3(4)-beta-glucanase, partial [Cryptosporangiaceae bacterium]|nr:endo,3(4)-beta-glucanase [Cryptosporangiaceae bacterium]